MHPRPHARQVERAAEIGARRGAALDALRPGAAVAQPLAVGVALVVAAASIAGLPPFSGFIGKLMILGATRSVPAAPVLWTVILATGFLAMVALARGGSILFWKAGEAAAAGTASRAALAPPFALLACGIVLAVFAAPVKRFTDAAARQIADTPRYAARVLGDPAADTVRPYPAGIRPGGGRP